MSIALFFTDQEAMQMDISYLFITALFFVGTALLIKACEKLRGQS
jgi:hypothetical protein